MAPNKKPFLIILAGPNGAGKSTFAKKLIKPKNIHFDGDKEIAKIEKHYQKLFQNRPVPSLLIEKDIGQLFYESINKAIKEKKNFILETNFRSEDIMLTVEKFKKNDFQTMLIYMALPNLKESAERVKIRVNKGGHQVDDDSIKYNFKQGTKNLIKYAAQFDQTKIVTNDIKTIK